MATKPNLLVHIRAVHKGVKYQCPLCDYQATGRGALREHKRAVHANIVSANFQIALVFKNMKKLSMKANSLFVAYVWNLCHQNGIWRDTKKMYMRAKSMSVTFACIRFNQVGIYRGTKNLTMKAKMIIFTIFWCSLLQSQKPINK